MTNGFDPDLPAPPPEPPTVEDELAGLQQELATLNRLQQTAATTLVRVPVLDRFGDQALGADGKPIFEETVDRERVNALQVRIDNVRDRITSLTPAGVSPSVAAQIASTERGRAAELELLERREIRETGQFETREERETREEVARVGARAAEEAAEEARTERRDRLNATLGVLENEIRIGNVSAQEATTRVTAAAEAADLQRGVLRDVGGRALPAGAQFFPNLGPSGPIAAATAALGQPFQPFRTGGTFGVNPAQLAATIPGAIGQSVVPGLDASHAAAQAYLASLGLPPPTPDGRQARPPQIGQAQAAATLAGG